MGTLPVVHERLPLRSGKFTPLPARKFLPEKNLNPNSNFYDDNLNSNSNSNSNSIKNVIPIEDKTLTRKQKLAVEYLVNGYVRTQAEAIIRAGYKPSVAEVPSEVFGKPNVKKELQKRRREVFKGLELTPGDIIDNIRKCAEANIADYLEILPNGSFNFNFKNCTREQLKVLKEVGYDALGRTKVLLHDERACWMDLAKLLGVGTDNANNINTAEGPLTIKDLDAIIAKGTTNNIQINQQINFSSEKEMQQFLPPRQGKVIEQVI